MRAIETYYRGRRFRSRIEARWAVFLDGIGVRWHYETEGYRFECDDGPVMYLPDFWLPDLNAWLEIKGGTPGTKEARKPALLASEFPAGRVYLMVGQFPDIRCTLYAGRPDGSVDEQVDYPWQDVFDDDVFSFGFDEAIRGAVAARFEHRETPGSFQRVGAIIAESKDGILGSIRRHQELEATKKPRPEGDLPA